MFFCHFDKKNRTNPILSYSRRSFVFLSRDFFNVTGTRTRVGVTNMFEKTEYKSRFSGLDISGSFDIDTRYQVFCIALGPLAICIPIGIVELLYLFYDIG